MWLAYCLLNRGSRLGAYVTSGTSAAYESSSGVNLFYKKNIRNKHIVTNIRFSFWIYYQVLKRCRVNQTELKSFWCMFAWMPSTYSDITSMIFSDREVYLFQLLGYPDLTVWTVIDLEPGGLSTAFSMPFRDDSFSSPPVKMDFGIKVWTKMTWIVSYISPWYLVDLLHVTIYLCYNNNTRKRPTLNHIQTPWNLT